MEIGVPALIMDPPVNLSRLIPEVVSSEPLRSRAHCRRFFPKCAKGERIRFDDGKIGVIALRSTESLKFAGDALISDTETICGVLQAIAH